jgi:hypothetical protein
MTFHAVYHTWLYYYAAEVVVEGEDMNCGGTFVRAARALILRHVAIAIAVSAVSLRAI